MVVQPLVLGAVLLIAVDLPEAEPVEDFTTGGRIGDGVSDSNLDLCLPLEGGPLKVRVATEPATRSRRSRLPERSWPWGVSKTRLSS